EGEVPADGVTAAGGGRGAAVGEFEVGAADLPRDEDLLDPGPFLIPRDPRDGCLGRVHRAGGHARVLRVFFGVAVERALALDLGRVGAGAKFVRAGGAEFADFL